MPTIDLKQAGRIAVILMLLGLGVIVIEKLSGGVLGNLKRATPFN